MTRNKQVHWFWVVTAALAVGCTGAIGPGQQGREGSDPAGGQSGAGSAPRGVGAATGQGVPVPTGDGTTVRDPATPARVVAAELRRLNRLEYDNTVRDLLGVDLRPAAAFPEDSSNYGFDNNANSLTVSGYLLELYLATARRLVDTALANPEARKGLLPCDPSGAAGRDCARRALGDFGRRAFRRPMTAEEQDGLLALAERHAGGGSFEAGVAVAMRAILVSPSFLFRVEAEAPADPTGAPALLGQYELASRLSYFLWSSMPDQALFTLAEQRRLQEPAVLEAEVRRMLAHPRARALVDSFAGQWLSLRLLDAVVPSATTFAGWSPELRSSMRTEAEMFFRSFIDKNRDVAELVSSQELFLDARLAAHYGVAPPPGAAFERRTGVSRRGGLLRQGGWLTLTSKPTRTSAVVRGEWVLSHLMCQQPPPPPPGVEGFPTEEGSQGLTQAQLLAKHRTEPACAACHASMDVIGLAFENYDPVGRWRDKTAAGVAISGAGELPGGRRFENVEGLVAQLAGDPAIGRCVTEKLLVYALGRGLRPSDDPARAKISSELAGRSAMVNVIVAIVQSDLVRKRSPQSQED